MTDVPITFRRINATPFRDLIRGRVTGRLDWPARLAAAGLPGDVSSLVTRVVRRTRLWRIERAAVADELVAHFADAMAAGVSPASAVRDFGDERAAAKLIRRAKRRGRPLAWHALAWAGRGTAVLLAVYVALLLPAALGQPRPSVDYVATLSAAARSAPADQRAWPLWRKAILACTVAGRDGGRSLPAVMDPGPGDRTNPAAQAAWLAGHADALALARRAAAWPVLGFVVGPGGSSDDLELFPSMPRQGAGEPVDEVLLPHLDALRSMANLLAADLQRAADQNDGGRVNTDADALLGLSRQLRRSDALLITDQVALGIDYLVVEQLGRVLARRPGVLADAGLVRLAHQLAGPQVAGDLLDVTAERMAFADAVQRMYTDDGHGDGRMTWRGMALLPRFCAVNGPGSGHPGAEAFAVPFAVASRATATAAYDGLLARAVSNLGRPRRQADWATPTAEVMEWVGSPLDRVRYAAVLPFPVLFDRDQTSAERYLGDRDGLLVGLSLELYHRRHDRYPATLAELTPDLLPAVPADRITGDPVRYRLVGGKPVVYSVGADRVDNGGRPAVGRRGRSAAEWGVSPAEAVRGDWVLYPPVTAK